MDYLLAWSICGVLIWLWAGFHYGAFSEASGFLTFAVLLFSIVAGPLMILLILSEDS